MLCAVAAKADQVGPAWNITAAGIFSAGGPESEAFALNWALTFESFGPDSVMPVRSGTTVFTGVLGTFTAICTYRPRRLQGGDGWTEAPGCLEALISN